MPFHNIPEEVFINNILPYVIEPPMKLLDWIDINNIDWMHLSFNDNAIDLLKANLNKVDWDNLEWNESPRLVELLKLDPN